MNTVNLVDEGADSTGEQPITGVLNEVAADDTVIEFPEGDYLWPDRFNTDHTNLKLHGENATIVTPDHQGRTTWLDASGDGFELDGFELDVLECSYAPRMDIRTPSWALKNFVVRGYCGTNNTDMDIHGVSFFRPAVTDEDGTGLMQDVYLHDGSGEPGALSNRRAVLVGGEHKGELIADRVWIEGWGENTWYGNDTTGGTTFRNCYVKNSQVGVRVGGDTTFKHCVFVKNGPQPIQGWSGGSLMTGVRIEGDDERAYPGRVAIRDCDFWFTSTDSSCGAPIVVSGAPTEEIEIADTRIRYDSGRHNAIHMQAMDKPLKFLELDNVHVENNSPACFAFFLGGGPDEWGTLDITKYGEGMEAPNQWMRKRMKNGPREKGSLTVNHAPPMPSPPPIGKTPQDGTDVGIPTDARRLTIDASNAGRIEYEIEVTGSIWQVEDMGATIDREDEVSRGHVQGWANNYIDSYRFTGDIVAIEYDGPKAQWYLGSQPFDPDRYSARQLSAEQEQAIQKALSSGSVTQAVLNAIRNALRG